MQKFKNGDMVYIRPMSTSEKDAYGPGWNPKMDKYEGQTLEIDYYMGRSRYRLKDCEWTWSASNLELRNIYDAF